METKLKSHVSKTLAPWAKGVQSDDEIGECLCKRYNELAFLLTGQIGMKFRQQNINRCPIILKIFP